MANPRELHLRRIPSPAAAAVRRAAEGPLRITSVLMWAQEARLLWRPELRFYEKRTELLRRFEQADCLKAFRWTDQSISAMLDAHADMEISSRSATLRVMSPRTVLSDVRRSLESVIDTLKPTEVTLNRLRLAVLIPLDRDFLETAASTGAIIEPALAPEARPADWSVLLDGHSVTTGFSFQVEYGVIRQEEAIPRLARRYARISPEQPMPSPELLDDADLPDCALFLDWSWDVRNPLDDDVPASLSGTWDSVAKETGSLSGKLQGRLGLVEATLKKEA